MLTIPNLVSLLRLLAVPVFLWLLLGRDDPRSAAILLIVIGATDWVDGALARWLDQVSEVGKFLDPAADRLAIGAAVVGGLVAGVLPPLIAVPLIVRETGVAIAAGVVALRGGGRIDVRFLGKAATFAVYGAVAAFFLAAAGAAPDVFRAIGWVVGTVAVVLYYLVLVPYATDALGRLRTPRAG